MAVSSLKGCWSKLSSRLRDYMDTVDAYYRPPIEDALTVDPKFRNNKPHTRRRPSCDRSSSNKTDHKHNNEARGHSSHKHHYSCFDSRSASSNPNRHSTSQQHNESRSHQLPHGYTKRKTLDGQVYFVNQEGKKCWYDPSVPRELLTASLRMDLDSLVGQLSPNWEIRHTTGGKTYYVDHLKKTTQFTDPRLVVYKDQLMDHLKHAKYATFTSSNNPCVITLNEFNRAHHTGNNGPGQQPSTSPNAQTLNANRLANGDCPLHDDHQKHNHKNKSKSPQNNTSRRRIDDTSNSARSMMLGSLRNLSTASQLSQTNHSGHSSTLTRAPLACLEHSTDSNRSLRQPSMPLSHIQPANFGRNSASTCNLNQLSPSENFNGVARQQTGANRDLFDKISILRQELLKQQVLSHPCRIDISRKRIFEESFRAVSQLPPRDLKKRLLIKFRGEEGLDYGGVAREWFYLLSRKILNPMHGLFQYTSDDIYNLQINPDSGIVYREHLSYLNFCGRIIGMAVFHGHFIEGHFTRPFYKMLLRRRITLEDIENVDPDLHRSLCWILDNDITNVIDTTFLVQHNALGQLQEHELIENGRNIVVTEENKRQYVSLYVNYRCRRGIESQFEALQRGFYELISPSLVEDFTEHELELLIGGLSKIDVEDWRLHTKLKNCSVETPLVKWFWDIVKSYSEDKRAQLLQFVTGSPRVPIQGFKALQGVNSELRLFTIHLIRNACTDNLPKSHTCFNRIDLPQYESYDKLRDKLTQAIEETMGFAMQ